MEENTNSPRVSDRRGLTPSEIDRFQSKANRNIRCNESILHCEGKDRVTTEAPSLSLKLRETHSSGQPLPSCLEGAGACTSHPPTCLGLKHPTPGPGPSSHTLTISSVCRVHGLRCMPLECCCILTAGCFDLVLPERQSPPWKTKPEATFASQVDKLSLFPLFCRSDTAPPPACCVEF